MIDLIVGSALLLSGAYLFFWCRSAALRDRIEKPKHEFLQQVRDFDRDAGEQP